MMNNYFRLAALAAVLVALPSVAPAADYHHVHLASPNVPEAVQWYITNIGCMAMNRPDACQIGTTQLIFANRKPDARSSSALSATASRDTLCNSRSPLMTPPPVRRRWSRVQSAGPP